MTRCEHFRALMLEYVYGLLEPVDGQELEQHAEACGACRAAFAAAQREQDTLAAAAKREFPKVRFAKPEEAPTPAVLPMTRTAGGSPTWFRWSVAAAILLGVVGLGLPTGLYSQQRDKVALYESLLEQNQQKSKALDEEYKRLRAYRDQAQKEIDDIEREIQNLAEEERQAEKQVWSEAESKQFRMAISGPKAPVPGAPNSYLVETRNLRNANAAADITVKVRNDLGDVVYEAKDLKSDGKLKVELPRDLPIKPNAELTLEVIAKSGDKVEQLADKLKLIAPVYLTHLTTDKPMYQPGEVVRFRSLTLERFSLRPAPEDLALVYTLTKPNGEQQVVASGLSQPINENGVPFMGPDKKPVRGIGGGEFRLLPDGVAAAPGLSIPQISAVGGEYTLSVKDAQNRFPEQKRKFLVNVYEKARLNKKLELARRSYGPGEKVSLTATAVRGDNESQGIADQPVTAILNIDGTQIEPATTGLRTDKNGSVEVTFKALPKEIGRGDASVSVTFTDGGVVESIVRPVPIVLSKLEVEYFPEGGDMIAGVPNRVYFQTRTTLGKPAELRGRILDETNAVACDVQTFSDPKQPHANHGMGVFTFTPIQGKKYRLQVDVPAGITELVGPKNAKGGEKLPDARADGVVLNVPSGVTTGKDPIHTVVRSANADRRILVGAYCRGRLMAHQRVTARKGEAVEVDLRPEGEDGGVIRVTAFEEHSIDGKTELTPVAERLVYRTPVRKLNLAAQTDRQNYTPGERVKLLCLAANEKGERTPAIVMVAVVDKSVLAMADEKTFKSLPTHFLLTTEVRRPEDLEHADFLVGDSAPASVALDLLLGTQGWRRFAEQNPGKFKQENPEEADRVLVLNNDVRIDDVAARTAAAKVEEVAKGYVAKVATREAVLEKAQVKYDEIVSDNRILKERRELEAQTAELQSEYTEAVQAVGAFGASLERARKVALPAFALALLLIGLFGLARGLLQESRAAMIPYLVGAAACLGLCAAAVTMPVGSEGSSVALKAFALEEAAWEADRVALGNRAAEELDANLAPRPEAKAPTAGKEDEQGGDKLKPADGKNKEGKGEGKGRGAADPGKAEMKYLLENNRKDAGRPLYKAVPAMPPMMRGPGGFMPPVPGPKPMAGMAGEAAKFDKERGDFQRFRQFDDRALFGAKKAEERRLHRFNNIGGGGAMPAVPGNMPVRDARRLEQLARQQNAVMAAPIVVREFAHHHERANARVRDDFTETVYWHPVLVLNDGKAEVSFQLSDSVTTFQVLAAGHTLDGRLGAVTVPIESRLPLTVEPKLPTEVTQGDKIDLPVSIANNTGEARSVDVRVMPEGLALTRGRGTETVTVGPDGRARKVWRLSPTLVEGEAILEIEGVSKGLDGDSKRTRFKVVPAGFPIVNAQSDLLEKQAINILEMPKDVLPGTLKVQVAVYPSTLADLQKGLEALLREPNGCFEQTSTSNYPNLLILNYLKETDQAKDKPQVAARAKDLLGRGYAKLTSFECTNVPDQKKRGYEWFGGTAPAHEALTAYGLMQFRDMASVHDVDAQMVDRTRAWLMARKDGKGGFQRNPRALDTFGRAPDHITNAYIVWALTESSRDDDVVKELDTAFEKAKTSKDAYFVALVANSLLNRNRARDAVDLLASMAKLQKEDGHLDAEVTSITGSGGRDLQIETTSLVLLGWMKAQRPEMFTKNIQSAVTWIGKQRGGYGGFGSTQSTILALKALITYAKANKSTPEPVELTVFVSDKKVASKTFAPGTADALVLDIPDAEKVLAAGKNNIRITSSGKNNYPYTISWSYRALTPVSADKCKVRLSTKLAKNEVKEGESVRLTATVENTDAKNGQGMALCVIGLPAGLTIPEDMKQLKDLAQLKNDGTERGTIDFFEIRGRELVLYWRDLAPGKKVEVNLDLIARVPGEYRGPASRAYLYYNADHKHWVDPLAVTIEAKAEAAAAK